MPNNRNLRLLYKHQLSQTLLQFYSKEIQAVLDMQIKIIFLKWYFS